MVQPTSPIGTDQGLVLCILVLEEAGMHVNEYCYVVNCLPACSAAHWMSIERLTDDYVYSTGIQGTYGNNTAPVRSTASTFNLMSDIVFSRCLRACFHCH
jgi:hypothetical protein